MRAGAVLLCGLLVAGCARPGGEVEAGDGDAALSEGVAATMEVKVSPDSVRLVLHVTNVTDAPLDFTFPTSQRYDFEIEAEDGSVVWRWSDDRMFLQAITEATLARGETWEFDESWDPGNRSGRFRAVGRVTAAEREIRQSATFELP